MTPAASTSEGRTESNRVRRERDQAVACAVLAVAMTCAALWNNFAREFPGLKEAQEAVSRHRELLIEHQKIMTAVNAALVANQQELEKLNRGRRDSH